MPVPKPSISRPRINDSPYKASKDFPKPKPELSLTVYIGIDPGVNGAIVALCERRACVHTMPHTDKDLHDLVSMYNNPEAPREVHAYIEQIHALPGSMRGSVASFKIGLHYGALCMCLTSCSIPYSKIKAKQWQKEFNIQPRKKTEPPGRFKSRLKAAAQELFPEVKVTLKNCDALLIALYCQRKHEETLTR